ncbi:MAG: hypothetical protein C0403_02000 [Desulfobacterium sp.]|nr:hypothetical protein [Desulfobacterium sp.]
MLNKQFGIIGFIVLLSLTVFFTGCKHHETPEEKMDRIIAYLTDDLDLTSEQNEILTQFKKQFTNRVIKINSAKEVLKNEVLIQLKSDSIDQEKIKEPITGIRAEFDELIPVMISTLAEFHKTLSIEQRTNLVKKLEDLQKLHCDK